MNIVGSCVVDGGAKFRSLTPPSRKACLRSDDMIVTESGSKGISAAYNAIIEVARARSDCEMVVLPHDDVEVVDANSRANPFLVHP